MVRYVGLYKELNENEHAIVENNVLTPTIFSILWVFYLLKTSILVTRTPLTTLKSLPRALTS